MAVSVRRLWLGNLESLAAKAIIRVPSGDRENASDPEGAHRLDILHSIRTQTALGTDWPGAD
jgi:hypothetical protein